MHNNGVLTLCILYINYSENIGLSNRQITHGNVPELCIQAMRFLVAGAGVCRLT